ncbi:MAG: PAS domain-containing protein, partial [Comamonadaceae bacterium]
MAPRPGGPFLHPALSWLKPPVPGACLITPVSVPGTSDAHAGTDRLQHLKLQAQLLDGIDVGMCAYDQRDCALVWNRSFLRMFPEHDGHITEGEHYSTNLRRFYRARLDAAEMDRIDRYIEAGVLRHQTQSQPYEFEHRGQRLQVSSLPDPAGGRIRVWRSLQALASAAIATDAFHDELGGELLESVPEALVVCDPDGLIVWANGSFRLLFDIGDRARVAGSTIEALYAGAWARSSDPHHPSRNEGTATLHEHLRFAGAPFELPLPQQRCCRVMARHARSGAVFYVLADISDLKRYEAALQLTLDNAGRGIIRYAADGRVLLFNRHALRLLDLPEDLLRGASVMDVVHFQRARGDFLPEEGFDDGVTGADKGAALFASGHYLRRTRTGRVLEISTNALPDGGAVRTYADVTEYIAAQRALTEKTRALQITLDSMSQGISAIDSTGRLVFWNRRYQELLQLPDALLADAPTIDKVVRFQTARGDFGRNFEYVDAVARGYVAVGDKLAPLRGPESYVRKSPDGRTFDVDTRPLPDGGVVRTFTDITAYVATQAALARKEAQLSALIHNMPDRVWLKDVAGRYVLSNPAHQH